MQEENEVAEPITEQVEQSVNAVDSANTDPVQPSNEAQINWKQAQDTLRLQRQEIDQLKQMMQNKPAPTPEVDEFDELDPEDYLTVGKARELAKKLASREATEAAKRIVQEYAQQQHVSQDEARCRGKYDDYDYVIDNFAIPAIKNDPVLAYKIQNSKNPAEAAYKWAKLDNLEGDMSQQKTSPKAEKILKNVSRPTSSAAAGSPLKSQADAYAKMSSADIWKQSQEYARRA